MLSKVRKVSLCESLLYYKVENQESGVTAEADTDGRGSGANTILSDINVKWWLFYVHVQISCLPG